MESYPMTFDDILCGALCAIAAAFFIFNMTWPM
jgi:hypothetical protein